MKKFKKVCISVIVMSMLGLGINLWQPKMVNAEQETISRLELVSSNMKWTYLDDLKTDPNKGTWYEEWNKKNGWTYPLKWLDWGKVDMRFSDEDWKSATGNAFSTNPSDDNATTLSTKDDKTAGPTYFFRHIFELKNPEQVKAIKVTVRYNDAMILYLNGKPLESFFNIPTSNYTSNLQYGSQVKVTDKYIEETIYMEDVSVLVDKYNPDLKEFAIAAEIHCSDESDTDAYFELVSFELNPDSKELPKTEVVKNVAVNVGENENGVNLTWFSLSDKLGQVQIVQGTDTTSAFPEECATIFPSTQATLAYTKFYDNNYYSNKAVVKGIVPGKDYIYRVGNADGWSKTYSLKTSDINEGYQVIFLSDAQIGTATIPTDKLGWSNTLKKALGTFPNTSLIANTGDFVDVATKESEYDAYFSPEILASYPTATAVGNHDIAANYGNHFNEPNMSQNGLSASNTGDYYFTYGNVLYMVLNTSNTNHQEHVQFMEKTIEATADQEFAWKVVMFHQSIYASGKQSTSSDVPLRKEVFVPAFDKLGIDIVLMGHDHCYARTYQMYNFNPVENIEYEDAAKTIAINPTGTLYLTTSSASGSKYYNLEKEYEYLAYREQSYVPTFSHLAFSDDTFTMTAYRTDTMEVFDTYTIKKITKLEETSLHASDVEIGYEEASKMNAEKMIELSSAKVVDTSNQEVEGYTITVNEEELKAITEASKDGGSYDLTITASKEETLTTSIKVTVLAKTVSTGSETTPTGSVVKTGDTTGVANWIWLLLASGFVMTGVFILKKRKES